MAKKRIDQLMLERNMVDSARQAAILLMSGKVMVNGHPITQPGMLVNNDVRIEIKSDQLYVSRGGYKLARALEAFKVDVSGLICADVGASTGGFTDVLLQRGAEKVYAIDVGYGDLAWKLRQDPRVIVMERTNARLVERLPEAVSLVVADVSFISLKLILPVVLKWGLADLTIITLVKPQFEAPQEWVEKGGVVRKREFHTAVLTDLMNWCAGQKLVVIDLTVSPVVGPAGNKEFLLHLSADSRLPGLPVSTLVEQCLAPLHYND